MIKKLSSFLLILYLIVSIVLIGVACSYDEPDSTTVLYAIYTSNGTHASTHENDGSDEISLVGLSGLLADDQHPIDSEVISIIEAEDGLTLPACELGGTVDLNSQAFDAGSGSANISTTAGLTGLLIQSTRPDDQGAGIIGYHDSTSPNSNDRLFVVRSRGRDTNNDVTDYGEIRFMIENQNHTTECGKLSINLAENNVLNVAMTLSSNGTLAVDAGFDTFDKYDDAKLLSDGLRNKQYSLLEDAGIIEKKFALDDNGKITTLQTGWLFRIQDFIKLVAGGVYQNRDKIDELVQENIELRQRIEALERGK